MLINSLKYYEEHELIVGLGTYIILKLKYVSK